MTLWMLYATLFGGLVYLAGLALERAARALHQPIRFFWLAMLLVATIAPVALPFYSAGLPTNEIEFVHGNEAVIGAPVPLALVPSTMRLSDAVRPFDRAMTAAWVLVSLVLAGRMLLGALALRRRRAQWIARDIAGTPCFVTPDIGPAVVAIPRPRIIVPEWMLSLDASSLATVIRHERQHLGARDAWLVIAGSLATAIMPWNPAVWLTRRRLRLALEMDCDARVLAEEPRVDRYGSLLLAIAQRPRLSAGLSATLTESTSDLERRIHAMTERPPRNPRARALAYAAAGIVAIGIACSMPAPDMVAPKAVDPIAKPLAAGDVLFDFQVEKQASANPANMPPRYPDQLRAANIEGQVLAKFVIDTTGHADMHSFQITKSDHDQFSMAVREALPNMRFYPAEVGGRKVKQLISMPFSFSLVKRAEPGAPRKPTVQSEVRAPATPRVLYEVPADSNMPKPLATNAPPVYPNQLRAANIQGMVQVKFVVRPDGRADMSTFQVRRSDHDAFTASVRAAVEQYRFTPAMVDGKPVSALMQMPFIFSLAR